MAKHTKADGENRLTDAWNDLVFCGCENAWDRAACAQMSKTDLNLGFVPRRQWCQVAPRILCFRADATGRAPRRPDVAHLAEDDKGTTLLLEQRFGGDRACSNLAIFAIARAVRRATNAL